MSEVYHTKQSTAIKKCPRCQKKKPLTDFRRNRYSPDGHQNVCKICAGINLSYAKVPRQLTLIVTSKICTKCGIEKDIANFSPNPNGKDGYHSQCRECKGERARRVYRENHEEAYAYKKKIWQSPERVEYRRKRYEMRCKNEPESVEKGWQVLREWQVDHPLRIRANARKRYAKKRGTVSERVNYEAILDRDGYTCHICMKQIDSTIKKGPASLVFDHVIPLQPRYGQPQGAHEASNICPAHRVCNTRKGNKPLEWLTPFARRGVD
jgi:hypothetical protein